MCVQEDVADRVFAMLAGAARELKLGDPRDPSTHIGPVVDAEAQRRLLDHVAAMRSTARVHYAGTAPERGFFVAPHIFELDHPRDLAVEIFGPILHVVRYRAAEQDALLDAIEATGYGLTLGIHTRIDAAAETHRGAAFHRQHLRQPQHDRRCGRRAAVRRVRPVRHRAESGRAGLPAAVRCGADGIRQHGGGWRECGFAGGGGVMAGCEANKQARPSFLEKRSKKLLLLRCWNALMPMRGMRSV